MCGKKTKWKVDEIEQLNNILSGSLLFEKQSGHKQDIISPAPFQLH